MELTVSPTGECAVINGQRCSVWTGRYRGAAAVLFVVEAGVELDAPPDVSAAFVRECGLNPVPAALRLAEVREPNG